MRLNSLDYFRGIAILFIVAGHSFGSWEINSLSEKILKNIISEGTVLFVFISGFLFHHIFFKNFNYKTFMIKKIKNVLIPFVVLTTLAFVYYFFSSRPFPHLDQLSYKLGIDNVFSWYEFFELWIVYLWTGLISVAYWYVPFIFIVFSISPLVNVYIKLSLVTRVIIFFGFLIISMFVHRPADNLSTLHNVIYFIPIYLLGVNCSISRDHVFNFLRGKGLVLAAMVFFLAVIQAVYFDFVGSFGKKDLFSYNGIDILIVQKILMCYFFISVLLRYESKSIPVLKLLATTSFAIYFIHPWVLAILNRIKFSSYLLFLPEIFKWLVTFLVVVIISLLIAHLFKFILKANSKYIVGW